MKLKAFLNVGLLSLVVLFSYGIVKAQDQTKPTTTPAQPTTAQPSTSTQPATATTITSTNPRVVVTDNLSKPATTATQATQPATTTKAFGKYSVNVTDNVTAAPATPAQNMENGKYFTVTSWDGSKWVTKRTWMPNNGSAAATPAKPNQ
jgi:hypothetical protein